MENVWLQPIPETRNRKIPTLQQVHPPYKTRKHITDTPRRRRSSIWNDFRNKKDTINLLIHWWQVWKGPEIWESMSIKTDNPYTIVSAWNIYVYDRKNSVLLHNDFQGRCPAAKLTQSIIRGNISSGIQIPGASHGAKSKRLIGLGNSSHKFLG